MKRKREGEDETQSRGSCSAYLCCGSWHALVRLYRPLIRDTVDETIFPGLTFFFSPQVLGTVEERNLISLSEAASPCDILLEQRPWKPCSVHGPFKCSCFMLGKISTAVMELEREFMQQERTLDVLIDTIDKYRESPFININTRDRTATLFLHGLPLPYRCYGPFTFFNVDDENSVRRAVMAASTSSSREFVIKKESKCHMCDIKTDDICCICKCVVCIECGMHCNSCKKRTCRACVIVSDGESLVNDNIRCFSCLST